MRAFDTPPPHKTPRLLPFFCARPFFFPPLFRSPSPKKLACALTSPGHPPPGRPPSARRFFSGCFLCRHPLFFCCAPSFSLGLVGARAATAPPARPTPRLLCPPSFESPPRFHCDVEGWGALECAVVGKRKKLDCVWSAAERLCEPSARHPSRLPYHQSLPFCWKKNGARPRLPPPFFSLHLTRPPPLSLAACFRQHVCIQLTNTAPSPFPFFFFFRMNFYRVTAARRTRRRVFGRVSVKKIWCVSSSPSTVFTSFFWFSIYALFCFFFAKKKKRLHREKVVCGGGWTLTVIIRS